MIDLCTSSSTLARFARELEAEGAPRALSPDLRGASQEDLEAAQIGWASRIVDEHRSVIVFSELLGLLATIGAPWETLAAVQRIIGDEIRHTKICAELASAFGPLAGLAIDLDDLALPPSDEPPARRAVRIVARELVIGEGESVAVLRAYRDATSDPACREALSAILADEARHAAAGKHLLERLIGAIAPVELAPLLGELPSTMRTDAATIRRIHRAAAADGPGRRYGVSIRRDEAPPALSARAA